LGDYFDETGVLHMVRHGIIPQVFNRARKKQRATVTVKTKVIKPCEEAAKDAQHLF
jgi:hypothetical protein